MTYFATYTFAGYDRASQSLTFDVSVLATERGSYAETMTVFAPFSNDSLRAMLRARAAEIANESLSAGITASDIVDLV